MQHSNKIVLVVKVLTDRPYNKEAFKTTMGRAWRSIKPLTLHQFSHTILMAEFSDPRDKALVMREGPWSFDNNIILVKEVYRTQQT